MMPVLSESSPIETAGLIATTIRFMGGSADGSRRVCSIRSRVNRAPGVSSSSSPSSSWRPSRVPSYRETIVVRNDGAKFIWLSRVRPRVTATSWPARLRSPRSKGVGFGVVVTIALGRFPRRRPSIAVSHTACAFFQAASSSHHSASCCGPRSRSLSSAEYSVAIAPLGNSFVLREEGSCRAL